MDRNRAEQLAGIIGEAMRLPEPERAEYIERACPDEAVRREARSLIAALGGASGFLDPTDDRGAGGARLQPAAGRGGESPGGFVGRYRLLQQIGEGGFGVVYMAEQREPVHRLVAVKVIKLGMDTRAVVARFEQERQALAMMDHPGIARVFDGGETDTGRPYFVMELVRGDSLIEHCDKQRLGTRERLELFIPVCRAVQHAHTKGVIHRDLKPGNVLVTTVDGRPVPKVIDFGIAKATGGRLTEKTLYTEFRQLVGTPAYMSPEQADNSSSDVDTRTDIYSLGVLLYELLTGVTPFDPEKLRSVAWGELQRMIREDDPPRPSTRLSNLKDTLPDVAARRATEPARLTALLRSELDWIVMRCLEKDRSRRYQTADALAADVERYLAGEAVEAAEPSAMYRMRKFIRRNRVAVTAGAAVAAALLAGLAAAIWQASVARQERDAAERSRRQTEQVAAFQSSQLRGINPEKMGTRIREVVLAEARAGLTRAGRSAGEIEESQARLASLLDAANMTNVAMRTLDENILGGAVTAVDEQFHDQPLIKAQLLLTLSETMAGLGLTEQAAAPATEALAIRRAELGGIHPATLEAMFQSANIADRLGQPRECERLAREVIDGYTRLKGRECREVGRAMSLAGLALLGQGRAAEGEAELRTALDLIRRVSGPDSEDAIETMSNLAGALYDGGKPVEAEKLFREVMEANRRHFGAEDPRTILAINNLAIVLEGLQSTDEAVPLFREALERSSRTQGEDHFETLLYMSNLGFRLMEDGKLDEAERYTLGALERRRRVLPPDHYATLQSMHNYGRLLEAQGRLDEAEAMLRDAYERRRRVLGEGHQWTFQSLSALGVVLRKAGRIADAEPVYRAALEGRRRHLGADHPDTLESLANLGGLLAQLGRFEEAEPALRDALAGRERHFGADNMTVAGTRMRLAECLARMGRYADAEPLMLQTETLVERLGTPERRAQYRRAVAELYEEWDKVAPNEGRRAEAARRRAALESTP